jgi:cytosine/adenosine deaminase-related metal-dependent hydrolase
LIICFNLILYYHRTGTRATVDIRKAARCTSSDETLINCGELEELPGFVDIVPWFLDGIRISVLSYKDLIEYYRYSSSFATRRLYHQITPEFVMLLGSIQYYHSVIAQEQSSEANTTTSRQTMRISGVHLPKLPDYYLWDVEIGPNNTVESITPINYPPPSAPPPSLLLPSLCHPHIHLDKAFLLTSHLHQYADLAPEDGSFDEALRNTSLAKTRYTEQDLLQRGSQLIIQSVQAGVTSMRAFVEIDHVTEHRCLKVAKQLKATYAPICHIQICAFAQDPVFSGDHGEHNSKVMESALDQYSDVIDCLGSTPYVEDGPENAIKNIQWAINTATVRKIHLDFHLDYNLDQAQTAMVWDVLKLLKESKWTTTNPSKTIALGHCTRHTLFSKDELSRLAAEITNNNLPVSFIGLPTSDIYMQGRPTDSTPDPHNRPRATLQIPALISDYNLNGALGINNVGNAFTPFGSLDPLQLACWGVGIYQAGREQDADILYESVSTRARRAIGLERWDVDCSVEIKQGQRVEFGLMLVKNERVIAAGGMEMPARQRKVVRDVVWDVPGLALREVVRGG